MTVPGTGGSAPPRNRGAGLRSHYLQSGFRFGLKVDIQESGQTSERRVSKCFVCGESEQNPKNTRPILFATWKLHRGGFSCLLLLGVP